MKEGIIETYQKNQSKVNGYLCYKWTSSNSQNGVPDRILIGHGKTIFVETKAPGEVPRRLQDYIHRQIRKHGGLVYVTDTKEKIDALFQELKIDTKTETEN